MAAGAAADSAAVSTSESATSGKSVRQGSRSLKKRYADRKHAHAASKSDESRKPDGKQGVDANGGPLPAMPDWVANASAQMTAADTAPADSARGMSAAMSEKANTVLQAAADKPADAEAPADTAVVAPDQLNDVDRALQETPFAAQSVVLASTSRPAAESAVQAANSDSSTLDRTSLIGKILIAFGALLTVASAARMLMA